MIGRTNHLILVSLMSTHLAQMQKHHNEGNTNEHVTKKINVNISTLLRDF